MIFYSLEEIFVLVIIIIIIIIIDIIVIIYIIIIKNFFKVFKFQPAKKTLINHFCQCWIRFKLIY